MDLNVTKRWPVVIQLTDDGASMLRRGRCFQRHRDDRCKLCELQKSQCHAHASLAAPNAIVLRVTAQGCARVDDRPRERVYNGNMYSDHIEYDVLVDDFESVVPFPCAPVLPKSVLQRRVAIPAHALTSITACLRRSASATGLTRR